MLREDSYVIIDLGSYMTRCGLGITDPNKLPSHLIPTQIAQVVRSNPTSPDSTTEQDAKVEYICGEAVGEYREADDLNVLVPFRDDRVGDWEAMSVFWDYILTQRFQLNIASMESPVLLAVPTHWSRNELEKCTQIFFERFNVPGLYIAEQPLLAAYSCGVLNGLVIDIGHHFTDVTPVIDSAVHPIAGQRIPLGGVDVDEHLLRQLKGDPKICETLGDRLDLAFCRFVKEHYFDLTKFTINEEDNDEVPENSADNLVEVDYHGIKVALPEQVLKSVDVLFAPDLVKKSCLDLVGAIEKTVLCCDTDKRAVLWDNIILTGGLSMMKGLQGLLERRMQSVLACSDNFADTQVREVKFCKLPEYFTNYKDRPDFMTYLGATIAAKLVFNDPKNYVNKVDYNETGPVVISTKAC
ncbi:hypothetical protein IWQ61_002150 [Dispira simplex]|nr:hypothetical protein IWQ61_002150 [Dispira simplex]